MKRRCAIWVLAGALLPTACSSPRASAAGPVEASAPVPAGSIAFGVVVEADTPTSAAVGQHAHWDADGDWLVPPGSIWTLEHPLLTCRVARAVAAVDAVGYPCVLLRLAPEDAQAFHALSTRCVGRRLAVLVDGRVVMAPRVVEPLAGSFELSGRFSERDVHTLLERLQPPETD